MSTTPMGEHPKIISVDREALNNGTFVEVPADSPSAVAQAGAGKVGIAEWAVIVDAETADGAPRRTDRRGLDQRPEHGHRLLG